MRVVIVGPAYPLRGGIADTNESFARAFQKEGHEVKIVTFSLQYPNFLFPGKTQYSEDPRPLDLTIDVKINSINPFTWWTTASEINSYNPDIVIFRYWLPFMAMSLGTIAKFLKQNIKKLAFCDNVIPHEKRVGDTQLTRYFVNQFDGFITMSGTVKSELEQFTKKPILCIPHPINDNLGQPVSKDEALNYLNLSPENNYLLFFGLVRKYKGLDLTLKALEHLKNELPSLRLIVAGEFYDDPQEYITLMEDLGVSDNVIIHNKYIATADIKYYFSACDLVIQTYHTASQSGVTQIALNFEKPILVTDVGGLSEVVSHNETGYVVEKNPTAITESVKKHFTKVELHQMINQLKSEKEKYSWVNFANRVIEFSNNNINC